MTVDIAEFALDWIHALRMDRSVQQEAAMTAEASSKPKVRHTAAKKVTLAHVAQAAGVSQATVSMILNGREGVSFADETMAAVFAAAEGLGYRVARRAAVGVGAPAVLVVVPNVTNPYYTTVIQAIQQAAAFKGYATSIYTTYRSLESELAALRLAHAMGVEGVIFTMLAHPEAVLEKADRKLPVVVIGDRRQDLNVDTVELNNYDAGSLVARHMHDLGHRHLAYISTTLDQANPIRTRRLQGLRDTFTHLCPEGSVLVKSRDISPETELENLQIEHIVGLELARKCLDDKKITGFVAVNDMVAYGVMDAVRGAGFSIPGDYSVCGFDNIFPSGFAGVALTTVEHCMRDKGRNALEILHNKISGAASHRNIIRVEYSHKLIARASTAAPRTHRSAQ